ncbi:hypothetical protein FO519_000987 [Halicephalobus sp. NKZ332]|nr:hypothetical protein FO519_000987 [Halicephalobus sp. NKZ332]
MMLLARQFMRGLSTDWRSSYSPEKAREYLSKFAGGSVTVKKDDESGIAKVLIQHEGKKNAFSGKMMVDLSLVLEELTTWDAGRVVVVEGSKGDFCSGADLNFVQQISNPNDGYMMNTFMGSNLRRLRKLPMVTIANAQGFVLGGATELYCACDIRTAKHGTQIGFIQARMGISPGWAGASRIVETIGRSRAIEVLAASSLFSAEGAQKIGLINFIYNEDLEFDKYLTKFTRNTVGAIRSCKQMVDTVGEVLTTEEKHTAERDIFVQMNGDNKTAVKHADTDADAPDSDHELDDLLAHLGSGVPLPESLESEQKLVPIDPENAETITEMASNFYRKTINVSDNCVHEVVAPVGVEVELFERQTEPAKSFPFELDEFQKRAINCVDNNQSVLVSAHTSAGKTVVALYAIALALKEKQRVIYTSPIKALSNQKYRELDEQFGDVGLMTGDVTLNPDSSCIVMTTEILRSMLYRGSPLMHEIGWVIFDEVHYMRDKERGVVWEETIIMLPHNVHFVFLSATIPNASQFASWICTLHSQPCHVVYTDYRPTPLQHFIYPVNGAGLYEVVNTGGVFNERKFADAMACLSVNDSTDAASKSRKITLAQESNVSVIIRTIMERDMLPCIVFSFSRKECEGYANVLREVDYNKDFNSKKAVETVFNMALEILTPEDRALPQVTTLLPFLVRGIGVHHSGLLPILKEVVELLFGEGLIKVLFATETFAMGLNMPARTVLFTSARKFDGKDNRWITSGEYIQMSGRAGRRGKDDKGVVILMCDQAMSSDVAKNLIKGKADPLNSQFRLTYNMILNLLRVEGVEPDFILKKSFFHFQNQETIPAMANKIALKKAEIKSFEVPRENDIYGFFELERTIKNVDNAIKTVIREPRHSAPYLTVGRIIRIVHNGVDFGYCPVIGTEARDNPDPTRSERDHFVKVVIKCDPETVRGGPSCMDRVRPPASSEAACCAEVLLFKFDSIDEITKVLIKFSEKKIETAEQRLTAAKQADGVLQRLGNQNIYLHPIENMKIKDKKFAEDLESLKKLKERYANHELRNDPGFKRIYQRYEDKLKLQAELRALQQEFKKAQSETLLAELEARKRVLRRLEYCTEGDIITQKGRVACEISAADELLLTEMIFGNVFKELDAATAAALLSCFVCQENSSSPQLADELSGALRTMQSYARRIAAATLDARLEIDVDEYVGSFRPHVMDIVYKWIEGQSFSDICSSTDIFEGSIIRCLRRLEELLREMVGAACSIGNETMQATFEEARKKLKRDIVFAASLYI